MNPETLAHIMLQPVEDDRPWRTCGCSITPTHPHLCCDYHQGYDEGIDAAKQEQTMNNDPTNEGRAAESGPSGSSATGVGPSTLRQPCGHRKMTVPGYHCEVWGCPGYIAAAEQEQQ